MASKLDISEVNDLSDEQFEWVFSNVIELCTDAASKARLCRPFGTCEQLCKAFHNYLDDLSRNEKITILKLHPDLAGAIAERGELTRESSEEQQRAGLHRLEPTQRDTIQALNNSYKSKFGFPFIICARENKVNSIIEELLKRSQNTADVEIATGIEEVKKICIFRVLDIVESQ